ncbi:MAG: ABC transporter substrate-binding protein [Oscillospiraceae bacterium]|jgi:oligopeptide transport system substrate-binding protein|nr:ABC transporter substrate-binding protein [Oscillospiraceae bacterium]
MKTSLFNRVKALLVVAAIAVTFFSGLTTVAAEEPWAPVYTYNLVDMASPLNWNAHEWEMSNESDLMGFVELALIDSTIAEDGVNFEWVYEGATAVTDITETFADKEKWGIPADATKNLVYQIDLNPLAKWENGELINADTYIYSGRQLLDPAMKNYRANGYYEGTGAWKNALSYYNNDKVGQPILVSLGSLGFASAGEAIAAGYDKLYVDMDGFWGVAAGKLPVEDDTMYRDEAVEEGQPEAEVSAKYLYDTYLADGMQYAAYAADYVFCENGVFESTPWEDVGLFKTGEYQITIVLEIEAVMFDFLTQLTSNWIVYEPLYEAGKETIEGLVKTNYGTSLETYMSSGPYKLVSFEKDKQLILDKNFEWHGYNDGKHEGQYQTDRIVWDIVPEHATQLMLFNQGKLDSVELTGEDMTTYRMSENLLKTDETYTFRFVFATDPASLKLLEEAANDGSNKMVLQYDDFRKALSLSMDRAKFCAEATSAYKPAYYLLNSLYYYNIAEDNESIYRNTDVAKEAVLNLYGITYGEGTPYATIDDAYDAVTGYDIDAARELFQSVYEKAIADGTYTDGQAVNINAMISASAAMTADDTKQQDLMNEFVTAATVGTGFEGKVKFTFTSGSAVRYDDVAAGRVEMIRGAWGGAAFYPFNVIKLYTEPGYMGGLAKIHESNGYDPQVETLDVTYDFDDDGTPETLTDTFQNWAIACNPGGKYYGNPEKCLYILSALETGVLETYQCIPWGVSVLCSLYSQQVKFATLNYNIMYAYGGIRLMTYNYTDAEWDAFVASQGGILSYE